MSWRGTGAVAACCCRCRSVTVKVLRDAVARLRCRWTTGTAVRTCSRSFRRCPSQSGPAHRCERRTSARELERARRLSAFEREQRKQHEWENEDGGDQQRHISGEGGVRAQDQQHEENRGSVRYHRTWESNMEVRLSEKALVRADLSESEGPGLRKAVDAVCAVPNPEGVQTAQECSANRGAFDVRRTRPGHGDGVMSESVCPASNGV